MAKQEKTPEAESFMIEFWDRINQVVQKSNMSQGAFAKTIGLHKHQLVSSSERCAEIRISTIAQIIKTYNVDANWLFGNETQIQTQTQTQTQNVKEFFLEKELDLKTKELENKTAELNEIKAKIADISIKLKELVI